MRVDGQTDSNGEAYSPFLQSGNAPKTVAVATMITYPSINLLTP